MFSLPISLTYVPLLLSTRDTLSTIIVTMVIITLVLNHVSLLTISPLSNHQNEKPRKVIGRIIAKIIRAILIDINKLCFIYFKFYFYVVTVKGFFQIYFNRVLFDGFFYFIYKHFSIIVFP